MPFSKRILTAEDLAAYLRSEKQIATAANTVEKGIKWNKRHRKNVNSFVIMILGDANIFQEILNE